MVSGEMKVVVNKAMLATLFDVALLPVGQVKAKAHAWCSWLWWSFLKCLHCLLRTLVAMLI